jgi:hypothetical protein
MLSGRIQKLVKLKLVHVSPVRKDTEAGQVECLILSVRIQKLEKLKPVIVSSVRRDTGVGQVQISVSDLSDRIQEMDRIKNGQKQKWIFFYVFLS